MKYPSFGPRVTPCMRYAAGMCLVAVLCACGGEPEITRTDTNDRPVKLISISGANRDVSARFPAVINAGEVADLSFLVGGSIDELLVTEAQDIKQGDVIARLGSRDFESSVASARASFTNADEEYQRALRLAEQDAIAQNVLKQRETQRDVSKAQLESAEKALADSVLRAPFSGAVANVVVRERQTISPGETIATVINIDTLEATINLPASIISQVPTREDRSAAVVLDANPEREIVATYREANLVADATSQTYSVTFSFAAQDNMLVLPGMNATVILNAPGDDSGSDSVSVPLAAVQSDGNGQYVWIVDADTMTVSRRGIAIEPGIGESVVVTAGLAQGDQIVGAGGAYLAEGLKVTPWTK